MLISWTVVKLNYGKNEQDMSDIQLFWNPLRKEQYLKNKVDIDLHLLSYKTTFSRLIMLSGWAYTNKPLISMLIMFHTGKSTEFLYFTDNHSQQLTKCLFKERKLYSLIHAFFFYEGRHFDSMLQRASRPVSVAWSQQRTYPQKSIDNIFKSMNYRRQWRHKDILDKNWNWMKRALLLVNVDLKQPLSS